MAQCPKCAKTYPDVATECPYCKRFSEQPSEDELEPVRQLSRAGRTIEALDLLRQKRPGITPREAKEFFKDCQPEGMSTWEIARASARGAMEAKAAEKQNQTQAVSTGRAEVISAQLRRLDLGSQILGRKELRELPAILWDDEDVLDVVQGIYENGTGILVATQKRLVFVDKGWLYGLRVEDFSLDKISSIQYETGLVFGSITIFTSGNKAVIKQVEKGRVRTFAESVRARISSKAAQSILPDAAQPVTTAVSTELETLAGLKERGLLTDEEFAAAKRRLLRL